MSRTFFSGDHHRGHKNSHGGIVSLCNRPFNSVDHNDASIIGNHNGVVTDNDDWWHLGDYAFRCSAEYAVEGIRKMNGRLHYLFGNHDKPLRQAYRKGLLDDLIKSGKVELIGDPLDKSEATSKMLKINGYDLYLSHYAHRSWPGAFRGSIHLFAHSHNKLAPFYKSMDVGVDAHHYYPIELKDVIAYMSSVDEKFSEK